MKCIDYQPPVFERDAALVEMVAVCDKTIKNVRLPSASRTTKENGVWQLNIAFPNLAFQLGASWERVTDRPRRGAVLDLPLIPRVHFVTPPTVGQGENSGLAIFVPLVIVQQKFPLSVSLSLCPCPCLSVSPSLSLSLSLTLPPLSPLSLCCFELKLLRAQPCWFGLHSGEQKKYLHVYRLPDRDWSHSRPCFLDFQKTKKKTTTTTNNNPQTNKKTSKKRFTKLEH